MRRSVAWMLVSLVISLLLVVALPQTATAAADDGVVHGILFYSPTCPHCHEVMTNVLPPLRDQYGDQLVIVEVDATTAKGGVVIAIADGLELPVRFVGVGEKKEDLRPFDVKEFVDALFGSGAGR